MSALDQDYGAPLPPLEALELRRRQRGRNLALLLALLAVVVLFYAISVVKFKVH